MKKTPAANWMSAARQLAPDRFTSSSPAVSPFWHATRVRMAGARAVLVGEALVCTPHEHLADTIAGLRGLPGIGKDAA